ncbi:MAG: sortase B protein-sorting domain-containing protein, partial [Lachnospiraceae bacterium]|nr:sortase B protein-sorting domain-containing protein [Lachnospiraceae bacterium]
GQYQVEELNAAGYLVTISPAVTLTIENKLGEITVTNKKEKAGISTVENQKREEKKAIITGDSANIILYISIVICAVGVLILLLRRNKRKSE